MSKEQFNPHDEKYKKVADLPEDQQQNFADTKGGGFIRESAAKEDADAELTAKIANTLKDQGMAPKDILHDRANEINEKKDPEMIYIKKLRDGEIYFREIPKKIPKELLNDKDFVLGMINDFRASTLEFASDELKADKDVVLAAAKKDGISIRFASEELKADKEVALAVIDEAGPGAFGYISKKLVSDKDFILPFIKKNGNLIEFVPGRWGSDKEVALAALKTCDSRMVEIGVIPKKLIDNNKDMRLEIIKRFGILYAPKKDKDDKEIMLEAVKKDGRNLYYASDQLKNDRKVVLAALNEDSYAFKYASDELKNNKEITLAAIERDGRNLQYASEEMRSNKNVVIEALKRNEAITGSALQYASKEMRADKEVVLTAVNRIGSALEYASDELKADKEVVLAAVRNQNNALEYADESIKKEIAKLI